jgi:hypothetical protein
MISFSDLTKYSSELSTYHIQQEIKQKHTKKYQQEEELILGGTIE